MTKREYSAPTLVEHGKLEEITLGTGWTRLDMWLGGSDGDGSGNPWNIGGGGSHGSA